MPTQPAFTCTKLAKETLEQGVKQCVNFEHISHLVLVFLLLTLRRQMPAGYTNFQLKVNTTHSLIQKGTRVYNGGMKC